MAALYLRANSTNNVIKSLSNIALNHPQSRTQVRHYCYATKRMWLESRATNESTDRHKGG
jgi:hypothetical protein